MDNRSPVFRNHKMERKGDQVAWKPPSMYWTPDNNLPAAPFLVPLPHPVAPQSPSVHLAPSTNTHARRSGFSSGCILCLCLWVPLLFLSLPSPCYPSINLDPTSFRLIISIWQQLSNRLMDNNEHLYFLRR